MRSRLGCGGIRYERADGCSVSLEYKSWRLVRELLLRTPLETVAGLLRDHKFITTVRATLHWLAQRCASLDSSEHQLDPPDSPHSNSADSSPSTLRASPTEVTRASRKRKRNAHLISHVPQNHKDVARLYTSICCNLIQLQDIAGDKSRGYAVEHILAALRSTPEDAAAILGSSLPIVDFILRNEEDTPTTDTSGADTSTIDTSMMDTSTTKYDDAWISPIVQYWRSQTSALDGNISLQTSVSVST